MPRGIFRCGLRTAASVFAFGVVFSAEAETSFVLQMRTTSLAVCLEKGSWRLKHYGERVSSAEDVRALAWAGPEGYNSLGQRPDAAYSVFGSANDRQGVNKCGGLCVTHANGSLTTDVEATNGELKAESDGVEHLVLRSRDKVHPFSIDQHFRAFRDSDVVETWVELRHEESSAVRLSRMDSMAMVLPHLANEFHVMTLTSQWGGEGQVVESPLVRGQTISYGARSGVRDAWWANPSFMLTVGTKATENSGRVIGGSLCWSGTWEIAVERDPLDLIELRAGAKTLGGDYVLEAGRTLSLPKVVLTFSSTGKGRVSRNLHRWARRHRLPDGDKLRPVLLNSWEGSYFNFTESTLVSMMDGVARMGGEMFVLDDGWFGNGRFARNNDHAGLGDWQVNSEKLPHGLQGLAAEAEKRGLRFGLWVEPEMANIESEFVHAHPDWILRDSGRPCRCGRGKTQVVLDFANPAVVDAVFARLDSLYASVPTLAYVKWDANCDMNNLGSVQLGTDRQANFWFDYTQGLYDLASRIRAKYPHVDLQACSSGGARMEYGFLGYADEFWTSDDTDARERVFIQWGASQFYPACAMAAHVTASPNHQTKRITPLKFRFDVAMSGRMGFELHPEKLSVEELVFATRAVSEYKRIRPVVQQGDLYRLRSPFEGNHAALMYVGEDRRRAVVFVYGLSRALQSDWLPPIGLEGLDDALSYRVTERNLLSGDVIHSRAHGKVIGGAALRAIGLPVALKGDFDSAVFELEADGCETH